jgi:3-isopropylmalate dehydratase small subunit
MSETIKHAQTIKYGDNVDTDVIIPARYLNTTDKRELAKHCMEDLDPSFVARVKPGNVMVAGKNFGCGSSREHAPMVIKESGISLIIAESFARIFYRNALNIGLPILESAQAARETDEGDDVSVDLKAGTIVNHSKNTHYEVAAYPPFIQQIIEAGGLPNLAKSGGLD